MSFTPPSYQQPNKLAPLFAYAQLLLILNDHDARYGTIGTREKFWARWSEREPQDESLGALLKRPLSEGWKDALFADRFAYHPLPSAPRFVAGETHYVLGRQYRLRIAERMPGTMVGIIGEYLEVLLRTPNSPEAVQRALKAWYLAEAKRVLGQELDAAAKLMRKHGIARPEFKLREMNGRWGSCTTSGVLILNPILVRVPIHCIRYVLLHELCHLRHHDHGAEFFQLLGRVAPDWIQTKKILEKWTEVFPPAGA